MPRAECTTKKKCWAISSGKKIHILSIASCSFRVPSSGNPGGGQRSIILVARPMDPKPRHLRAKTPGIIALMKNCRADALSTEEQLARANNLKGKRGRRTRRNIKQAAAMQVRSLVARVFPMQATQEATTATVKQSPQ